MSNTMSSRKNWCSVLLLLLLVACSAQRSSAVRCAVDNAQVVRGGSKSCASATRCFTLVHYFGETNSIAPYFVGPSNAYLVQAQGCFRGPVAPLSCSRRQCVLAMTQQDVRKKPFQFCCCTGDHCNAAQNVLIRQLEPAAMRNQSVRSLARNQEHMEAFVARHIVDEDALWDRWTKEMFEQFKEEVDEEQEYATDA